MGGGGDSRIPSILKDNLGPDFEVIIRTYDFDPEIAQGQLAAWAEEVRPELVIGESMGATHAIALIMARLTILRTSIGFAFDTVLFIFLPPKN